MVAPSCIVPILDNSEFTLHNIPFGVFSIRGDNDCPPRPASAIGSYIIDLKAVADLALFDSGILKPVARQIFSKPTLNDFMGLGRSYWREARRVIQKLLSEGESPLEKDPILKNKVLIPRKDVNLHLPISVGDYTDFYASKEHATNVGTMFRGKENALQPNWLHLPVGYHGRASSVIVSGTPVVRPKGQIKPKDGNPIFGPSQKMDFELEMAFVVGVGNELGQRITVDDADDHIFGVVLMNDWSARDIQAWEYVPLGPFLGKNFGTVISPWIVTLDALEPFLTKGPHQDPCPLDYLKCEGPGAYDIDLTVAIKGRDCNEPTIVSRSNLKYLYWNFRQQLAHHTINGCNMKTGDLCGTGTISGPNEESYGSLLELSWNGQKEITLSSGAKRTFLEDGDVVILSGSAKKGEIRIGFGECISPLLPPN